MKKLCLLLMSVLACLGCFACSGTPGGTSFPENSGGSEVVSPAKKTYPIVYKAVVNGNSETEEIPAQLWLEGEEYPSIYTEGEDFLLGDLLPIYQTSTLRLEFLGWYADAACETPFTVGAEQDGEVITIYAKIKRERYTIPA